MAVYALGVVVRVAGQSSERAPASAVSSGRRSSIRFFDVRKILGFQKTMTVLTLSGPQPFKGEKRAELLCVPMTLRKIRG